MKIRLIAAVLFASLASVPAFAKVRGGDGGGPQKYKMEGGMIMAEQEGQGSGGQNPSGGGGKGGQGTSGLKPKFGQGANGLRDGGDGIGPKSGRFLGTLR